MTENEFVVECNKVTDKVFRYAKAATHSVEDAEDIVQNTILKAWKNIDRYDPSRSDFSTWFISIYKYTLIDFFRNEAESGRDWNTLYIEDLLNEDEIWGLDTNSEELLYTTRSDDRLLVEESLTILGGIHEQVVRDCFIGGMTFEEVSKTRGIAKRKIRRILATGLKRLEKIITEVKNGKDKLGFSET